MRAKERRAVKSARVAGARAAARAAARTAEASEAVPVDFRAYALPQQGNCSATGVEGEVVASGGIDGLHLDAPKAEAIAALSERV